MSNIIEIKNRFTGDVIYSHTCIDNTIKETVKAAVASGAGLHGTNLSGANLSCTNLSGTVLLGVDLRDAVLIGADLRDANLVGADLRDADLHAANLRDANLCDADLSRANLCDADLSRADLSGANLCDADLRGTGLYQFVGVGSVARCTTYDSVNDKVICGCFYGSLDEFEQSIKDTHAEESEHNTLYLAGVAFFRIIQQYKTK